MNFVLNVIAKKKIKERKIKNIIHAQIVTILFVIIKNVELMYLFQEINLYLNAIPALINHHHHRRIIKAMSENMYL